MFDKEALIEKHLDDIAIVSMAGRFPGAETIEQYWHNLENEVESISFFSQQELVNLGVDPALLDNPDFIGAEGVLNNVESFDAEFFGISPREAELLDPQHRLFLEVTWELLEKAGYSSASYEGEIGVYAGAGASSYLSRNLLSHPEFVRDVGSFKVSLATGQDFLTTRASYKLGLTGPSINVNTLCSSSAVAVHYAREALLAYQCDIAIAGGVTVSNSREDALFYQEGGIGSFDGHCRAFDEHAAGTVAGNGIALVALKRMEDAINDNDQILAVIKGTAVNNDGSDKASYTAPSPEGQSKAIAEALAVADVHPDTISYIEAHGTGTNLGDPIEVSGLTRAFRRQTEKKQYCGIGSVKTNIGHLVAAGGVASLIKTVLGMQHQKIPANLNFNKANPKIDFANSPFYVVDSTREWKPTGGNIRRAGVSSFGIGGTNAHIVVEEAPTLPISPMPDEVHTVILSAKTDTALVSQRAKLREYIEKYPDINLADLAYTLQVGRHHFEHKFVACCCSVSELNNKLAGTCHDYCRVQSQKPIDRNVCFMFPGQGSQHVFMAHELYQSDATFKATVDECCDQLIPHVGLDIRGLLYPEPSDEAQAAQKIQQTQYAQVALFVIEYALANHWQRQGIQPDQMIGHSIGEYVAACIAGVFSLSDALKIVAKRASLMAAMESGSMLAVQLSEQDLEPYLTDGLWHAVQNGANMNVIAGTEPAIADLKQRLISEGHTVTLLHTSHAFHSGLMDRAAEQFAIYLQDIDLAEPTLRFMSNVSGQWATSEVCKPEYWAAHLKQTVRFGDGIAALLSEEPDQLLIEVGPGQNLTSLVKLQTQTKERVIPSFAHPKKRDESPQTLAFALGAIWLNGVTIDWIQVNQGQVRQRIELPTYPFEHKRYWIDAARYSPQGFKADAVIKSPEQLAEIDTENLQQASVNLTLKHQSNGGISAEKLTQLVALQNAFSHQVKEIFGHDFDITTSGVELKHRDVVDGGAEQSQSNHTGSPISNNARPGTQTEYVPPVSDFEHILVNHWEDVLGYHPVGIHDNFFEMGGHSLMAAALANKLRSQFEISVDLGQLLQNPTIAQLSELLDTQQWLMNNDAGDDVEGVESEEGII